MSVERMQTVLQLSMQGADQVVAQLDRVLRSLAQLGDAGKTPIGTRLSGELLRQIDSQRPGAASKLEELQTAQLLAERKAIAAVEKLAEIKADTAASAEKEFAAENAALAAAKAESAARRALQEEIYKLLPEVQDRIRQEKLGAQMARDYVAAKRKEAQEADKAAREQEAARKSLDRQRQRAYDTQYEQRITQAAKDRAAEEEAIAQERARELRLMKAQAIAAFRQLPGDTAVPQDQIDQILKSPDRNPADTDKVYRAREMLAEAETRAAVAHQALAEATQKATMGEGRSSAELVMQLERAKNAYSAASRGVIDAEAKLAKAIDTEALAHAENTKTTWREDFLTGFKGRRDATMPEQLGQAFKFSLFYGSAYKALFMLTQTLQQTLQEGIQFQQAMTDLSIASGRSKEALNHIADQLGESATRAGFSPSQSIEIGARSLGLYGATEASQAVQDQVMSISAKVVNQLAQGSGQQPVDLQGNIAAIAQALGMGAAGQFTIADLDAYMTKKFGAPNGSTLESVAQSASVGKAAGFTDQQLFAIAADMISRTGQSPSAVGGYMAQIFSRGGEGSLTGVASKYGIDTTQTLAQIVQQLANIYQTANPNEQAQISASFGRGKIQNAAVALLSDYAEVQRRAGQAANGAATGQADTQFQMRMGDIGGQIAQTTGVLKEFADLLGRSGLLDALGVTIVTFRDLVKVVNDVLRLWNGLPGVIRETMIALVLLTAASKAAGSTQFIRELMAGATGTAVVRSAGGTIGTAFMAGRGGSFLRQADANLARSMTMGADGQLYSRASGFLVSPTSALREAEVGGARAGMAGLAKAGTAALGLVDPIVWAVGGLMAIGALKSSADNMAAAQDAAAQALLNPSVGPGSSSSDYTAYASQLSDLADQNRHATGWLMRAVTFGQADNGNQATADRLDAEAKRLNGIAARLQAQEQASATTTGNSSVFASLSASDISSGLQSLQDSGASASEQLKALRDVLLGTADAANAAAAAFSPGDFASQNARPLLHAASGALKGFKFDYTGAPFSKYGGSPTATGTGADLQDALAQSLTGVEAQKKLKAALAKYGVSSLNDLDPATAQKVAAQVGGGLAETLLAPYRGVGANKIKQLQKRINNAISQYLLVQSKPIRDMLDKRGPLSATDATAAANSVASISDAKLGLLAQNDSPGRIKELRSRIGLLKQIQAKHGPDEIGQISDLIDAARKQIAAQQIDDLERLRKIAQHNAKSKVEIAKRGKAFAEREIRAAIRAGDADQLAAILSQAGKWAKDIAQRILDEAIASINAAKRAAREMATMGQYIDGQVRGAAAGWRDNPGGDPRADPNAERKGKKIPSLKHAIGSTNSDPKGVFDTGSDSNNPLLDTSSKSKKDKDTPAEIAAARAAAYATRSEGQMAAARAAIQGAKAQLAKAKKNTVAYWQAMDALFQAQNQFTDAVEQYKHNLGALHIDMTNPLAMARLAVRDAARKLRDDQGKAPDVLAQDRVDLKTAQASREATAFSQRLQAVQTADELGRISHKRYLAYLQHEHDRLAAIKHRTFQQQDELNQIDSLMKDAAKSMQGQFNLGDIKLPTPYQVRRYIEQRAHAATDQAVALSAGRAGVASTQNTTIYINGADTGKVESIIRQHVGKGARVTATSGRKR